MTNLIIKSLSKNMLENIEKNKVSKIQIYDFENGKKVFNINKDQKNEVIGAVNSAWIRIFTIENTYYDFLTATSNYFKSKDELLIMCSNDTEYITLKKILEMLQSVSKDEIYRGLTGKQYINIYFKNMTKELEVITKKLEKLFDYSKQTSNSKMKLSDKFASEKEKLEKKYLLLMLSKQLVKENRNEIIERLS